MMVGSSGVWTNLSLYSEQFDNLAAWFHVRVSVTQNAAISPVGTMTADAIIGSADNNNHRIQQSISTTVSSPYVWSTYVKAGNKSWVALQAEDLGYSDANSAWFNIGSGVVGTRGALFSSSQITDIGSGWYRISAVVDSAAAGGATIFHVIPGTADQTPVYTGNASTVDLYTWGAQLTETPSIGPYVPTTSAAVTCPDTLTQNGLEMIGVSDGATNLVSTKLDDGSVWIPAGGSGVPVVTPQGGGVYRIDTSTASGASAIKSALFASGGIDRVSVICAKFVSGTWGKGSANQFTFRESSIQRGTDFNLETLTDEYQQSIAFVLSSEDTNELALRFDEDTDVIIEVKMVRAHNSAVAHPAHVDGTAAGDAYATDVVTATPTWPGAGTIMMAAMPYGYSGANNPASEYSKFFEANSPTFVAQRPGAVDILENLTGGSVTDGVISVLSADWDGVLHGARWNTDARMTRSDTDVPAGIIYLGNRADGARPFHGGVYFRLFDEVLSEADYSDARAAIIYALRGLTNK